MIKYGTSDRKLNPFFKFLFQEMKRDALYRTCSYFNEIERLKFDINLLILYMYNTVYSVQL